MVARSSSDIVAQYVAKLMAAEDDNATFDAAFKELKEDDTVTEKQLAEIVSGYAEFGYGQLSTDESFTEIERLFHVHHDHVAATAKSLRRENPNHVPAGSPDGGQFAPADGGGSGGGGSGGGGSGGSGSAPFQPMKTPAPTGNATADHHLDQLTAAGNSREKFDTALSALKADKAVNNATLQTVMQTYAHSVSSGLSKARMHEEITRAYVRNARFLSKLRATGAQRRKFAGAKRTFTMRTRRISADEAHASRKDHLRGEADGREVMLKVAKAPPSWDATKRSARFIMTSQAPDRMGDIVVTSGLDTTEFEKNPMVFLFHNSASWSVGTWANVEKQLRGRPPRMEGDAVLHPEGGPIPEIDQAAWMISNGGLKASSIGFLPDFDEVEMILDASGEWNGGLQFNKAEMIECSLVGIPANPQALAKAFEAGVTLPQEIIEDVLDAWRRTPEGALIPREDFEKSYQLIKTAGAGDSGAVDELLARMEAQERMALCEKHIVAGGMSVYSPERVDAIERAAKQKRLADARLREKTVREQKINLLRQF